QRAYALVAGVMGGIMPSGLAKLATSALLVVMPGYNLFGLAIYSVTASAYARDLGRLLVDHFETEARLRDSGLPAEPVRRWRDVGILGWARRDREWSRAVYR